MTTISHTSVENALIKYFEKYPSVIAVYIFGSFRTNKVHPKSDIDIGVLIKPGQDIKEIKYKFINDISNILGMEVDLVILNTAPPILKHQILSKGKKILEKNTILTRRMIARYLSEYFDFQPFWEMVAKRMLHRIRS